MRSYRVGNLGAGTQSSVLAIMCDRGDVEPVQCWIFADTKAEPAEVYSHLDWLERQIKTPIVRVCKGDLETDAIRFRANRVSENPSNGRKGYASIPLFVLNPDGTQGIVRRQCTSEYKIAPIVRYIKREIVGLKHGERMPSDTTITQVFGISHDERQRCRRPTDKWSRFDYPLVDRRLNRWQVIELAEKWFPDHTFPRSACVFCPYRSNEEWRRLRDEHPADWKRAVAFDHAIRAAESDIQPRTQEKFAGRLLGMPFVHRQCVPLDEADLRSDDEKNNQWQLDFSIQNECEGMCGV